MESSQSESDERDIEQRYSCSKKRSIAGGKQRSSKKQKRDDGESKCFYFFTLPSIFHYFLMLQVVTNNSMQNVEKISFYYIFLSLIFCRYFARTYFTAGCVQKLQTFFVNFDLSLAKKSKNFGHFFKNLPIFFKRVGV